jgi:tRNA nucleotidyltransferase (CCA-adding enzyme)
MLDLNKFKVYVVGGYVRDRLLGREAHDHDFVVCGATPDDMINAGFKPIAATEFPVFHHPITNDEYALARTEKKVGSGYHGFECFCDPSLTIEDDLFRRDITINAMAREVIGWNELGHAKLSDDVIDPYGGQEDLFAGRIAHVSEFFHDDPVRVLRVARFACRYGFGIDNDTFDMMKWMVRDGELDSLTAERVWLEASKAMMENDPMDFFHILNIVGALEKVMPQLNNKLGNVREAVTTLAEWRVSPEQRFAALTSRLTLNECESFYRDLKAPSSVSRLAIKANKVARSITKVGCNVDAEWVIQTLELMDAFRNDTSIVTECRIALAPFGDRVNNIMRVIEGAYFSTKDVRFDSLSTSVQSVAKGKEIGEAIRSRRVEIAERVI